MSVSQTAWVYVGLFLFAMIDGFFPPIPSESAVIALASLSASTGHPAMLGVGAAAALGAFTGDHIAYAIGRHVPLDKIPGLRSPRGRNSLPKPATNLICAAQPPDSGALHPGGPGGRQRDVRLSEVPA